MASTADLVTDSVPDVSEKKLAGDEPKTFGTMTNRERFAYVKEVITIEPVIASYMMAATLCQPAVYSLEIEKACRANIRFNDSICDGILMGEFEDDSPENKKIQVLISNVHTWQQPLQSVMPLLLVLFLGSYSDRHKLRKPFIIVPIIGELFAVAGCIFSVVYMRQLSLEVHGILQTVVSSFFGGSAMILMAVFAYIADVSTVEMRTIRVGVVQIVLNCCTPIVQAFSGDLFIKIGYIGIFIIAGCLFLVGILYGIFFVKEPKQPDLSSKRSLLVEIFDPLHALQTFAIILKKKPGNDRVYIFLVLLTLFVFSGVVSGEGSLSFLWLQNSFKWTVVDFSYFSSVNTLVHLIGTILALPLFTKILNLSDMIIILLAFADKILANIVFGLANSTLLVYIGVFVSVIIGVTAVAIRSLATKIVAEDDLGKAQSLFAICETLAPMLSIPIYNKIIYVNTIDTLPSGFCFVGCIMYLICCIIILWMYIQEKRKVKVAAVQGDFAGITTNGTSENPIPLEKYSATHMETF